MEINKIELKNTIYHIFEKDNIHKITISNPANSLAKYKKIVLENKTDHYLETSYTEKQAFSNNLPTFSIIEQIYNYSDIYKQINIISNNFVYAIRTTKKNKILLAKNKNKTEFKATTNNNRVKNYIFKENEIIPPLIDMGIFTTEGKIINSMYDKYKQINRFIELIDDYIKDNNFSKINIVDFGCGKSYLTFVVYYYFKFIKHIDINMVGLDLKEDVINKCNATARKYGYDSLHFELGDINGYKPTSDIDVVISLHACDTATDYALYNAVDWKVKMIFSVPCCQHELNKQISSKSLPIITRYGLIKERISSDFTDIVRCNLLKAMSYNVELIEFVAFEHTPKNILIRANISTIPLQERRKYLQEVLTLEDTFCLNPKLHTLLKDKLNVLN